MLADPSAMAGKRAKINAYKGLLRNTSKYIRYNPAIKMAGLI